MMNCRSCENQNVTSIFSFGPMPLANRLLKKEQLTESEPQYPLEIMLCQKCGLVQLKDIVSPEDMFDEYLYFSSNSETMLRSAKALVDSEASRLTNNAIVIEIASNDGYLLQYYLEKNMQVLGIEPAKNIAKHAIEKGISTRCEYFTEAFAKKLVYEENIQADIIHANNVMAHVPDINNFVSGIRTILKPSGQAIIEVPYLLNLVKHNEFDTIYHEHVFYFSLTPLVALFKRHKLLITNVEEIPIHGGSLRLFINHDKGQSISKNIERMIDTENKAGVTKINYYQHFATQIHQLKNDLTALLESIKKQGKKIAAYGASAKGSTLLNFFDIAHLLDYIVDRSPVKQGYYMSGAHLPIYSPAYLLKDLPPYTLLLTWNFSDEILKQQRFYREQGGKFIIPIPQLEVV